ncbi:MAG: hypothetical protein IJF67_13375 [Clostridia bacterium]|nr:hypothetical protein [Clostridia bacterium]
MRFLILLAVLLTFAGCAQTETVHGRLAETMPPALHDTVIAAAEAVMEPPPVKVSYYTHTADYYPNDSAWIATMSIFDQNRFFDVYGFHNSGANPYEITFTVPFDWIDDELTAQNPAGTVRLQKRADILHMPKGGWPPNSERLTDVVTDVGGTVIEKDGILCVKLAKKYWTYYVPMGDDIVVRVEIYDENETPDTDFHFSLARSVELIPAKLRLIDTDTLRVYQIDRETLEIVRNGSVFTVTGHPTDDCYEVLSYGKDQLTATVFRRDEQYQLLMNAVTGEVTAVHAPTTAEALQTAGIDIGDAEILAEYRKFDRFGSTLIRSLNYLTTTEGEYIIEITNGTVSYVHAAPYHLPVPSIADILASFNAMRRTLQIHDPLAIEHNENARIDGRDYLYSYSLGRNYDAFLYAIGQRLTADCAEELLHESGILRAEDGRLLHCGEPRIAWRELDMSLADISQETDGVFLVKIPERRGADMPILRWHAFRYVYEDGAWRWDFDMETEIQS